SRPGPVWRPAGRHCRRRASPLSRHDGRAGRRHHLRLRHAPPFRLAYNWPMLFDEDAFISYAHLDNVELVEGRKGWVANLHRALEVRVGQLLGKKPEIWRDPKLTGNDILEHALLERLRRVTALISVVSPRYVRSEWSLRELTEF